MRRIVETDCVLAVTKHFSSRVINGIARYFMRLLLQARSQTDTAVSFPTYNRCEPIKYELRLHQRKIFIPPDRSMRFEKSVNINIKLYLNFGQSYHIRSFAKVSTKPIFMNPTQRGCSIHKNLLEDMCRNERKKRELVCQLL